jgi:plasmid stability protein
MVEESAFEPYFCSRLEPIRMPVNLSIKNAPDDIVKRLKERAAKHHRSLQGELLAIIEEAVRPPGRLTPRDVLAEVRRLVSTPLPRRQRSFELIGMAVNPPNL